MSVMRTFLAIDLPDPIRRRTEKLIASLQRDGMRLRWSSPDTLHLTLCFLGDIEDVRIHDACSAVKAVAETCPSFDLQLNGVGAFPKLDRARVVWAGVSDGFETVVGLQREVRMGLEDVGFALDRGRYHPHITLGRVPQGRTDPALAAYLEPHLDDDLGRFPVKQLTLFNSHLERSGPIHSVLARIALGG